MMIHPHCKAAASRLAPFVALLVSSMLLMTAAATAQAPTPKIDQDAEYAACLDMAKKKPDAALERAKKWWDSGGNLGPRHCIAVALIAQENYVQAAKILEDLATDAKPEVAALRGDLFNQAGQAYYLAGMFEKAIPLYTKALLTKPRDVDYLIDRAVARDEFGQHFEAIDDLNRAIDLAPARADALVMRASAWRRLGNLDLAEDDGGELAL